MTTDKQIAANRANATRSTGPRTAEGKTRVALNARKHGFAGDEFSVNTVEDRKAVERLREDLLAHYKPANSQEIFAVERIALTQHALLRLARLEVGICNVALEKYDSPGADSKPKEAMPRPYCLARGFHDMNPDRTWILFLRYQAQAERNHRRAIDDLERLRQQNMKIPNKPIWETDPHYIRPYHADLKRNRS